MSSRRFTPQPTSALQATASQTLQRALKQQRKGQLCLHFAQTQHTLGNEAAMNTHMPQQATQDEQAFCAAVEAPQANAACAMGLHTQVAGAFAIAEPCMPEHAQGLWPVPAVEANTTEPALLGHTQELFVGTEINIILLPCLGLIGDDQDFPGTRAPGDDT